MNVEFFGPFDKLAEKRVHIALKDSILLKDLLWILADRYPGFARYCHTGNDGELSAHITIIRSGIHLKLSDRVNDKDTVSILLPATGG
jgi:hypothetical protein